MIKKILIGLGCLVLVIGAGVFYLGSNIEPLIKKAVETYGSEATKTSVSLSGVSLSLTDGKGSLSGLSIGNPEGFSSAKAFFLGQISLQVDAKSIPGDGPIIIKEIMIDKPQITYEVGANGENNLSVIAKNVKEFGNRFGNGEKAPAQKTSESSKPERKLIIKVLTVQNGTTAVSHALLKGKALDVALPNIYMTNIGKDGGGVTASQITALLLNQINSSAIQSASAGLTKEISAVAGQQLDKVGGKLLGGQLKGLLGK